MRKIFFFGNITKTDVFLENRRLTFLDIEKNFAKTKFQTNLIRFRTVGGPRSLEGIVKLGTIREPFA